MGTRQEPERRYLREACLLAMESPGTWLTLENVHWPHMASSDLKLVTGPQVLADYRQSGRLLAHSVSRQRLIRVIYLPPEIDERRAGWILEKDKRAFYVARLQELREGRRRLQGTGLESIPPRRRPPLGPSPQAAAAPSDDTRPSGDVK